MNERLRVYPTRLKVEEEESRKYRTDKAAFSKQIISIFEFEGKLIKELVPHNAIGEVERWLLIHQSVMSEKSLGKNRALSRLVSSDGFVRSVGELIQQIKLGLVNTGDIEKISGFAPGKEGWVKKVFTGYQQFLKKHALYDSADINMELIKRLEERDTLPVCLRSFSGVDIFDIYHYTPFRFEMVTQLARHINIVIHFPLPDERRKAFDFVEREIQKFQSLAGTEGRLELQFDDAEIKKVNVTNKKSALEILSSRIFSEHEGEERRDISESVEVVVNSGRYREIEEVAARIIELKGERSWSDFCVVFRQLSNYGNIIEDVFRRAGIPVYIRRGLPVKNNPMVRTVLGIFNVIETGFDRDEVVKLISSDYFGMSRFKEGDSQSLEKIFLDAGIICGPPSLWEEKIKALIRSRRLKNKRTANFEYSENISNDLEEKISILREIEKLSLSEKTNSTIAIFNKLLKTFAPKQILFGSPFFARDLYCQSRLTEVLAEMDEAVKSHKLSDERFGWIDLRRLLLNSLGNVQLPDWSDKNHVYALNIHELAGRSFPFLFVCGLHDGEFPLKSEHGSILSESEKKIFNEKHSDAVLNEIPEHKKGRQVFSRLGETWDEESFLFYLATRLAKQKIFYFYSTHGFNGKELGRSQFLHDVKSVFPSMSESVTKSVALEKEYFEQIDQSAREAKLLRDIFNQDAESAGRYRDYYIRFANNPVSGKSFLNSCERSLMERKRNLFYSSVDAVKRSEASGIYTGKIGKMGLFDRYIAEESKRGYSASTLEKYSNCPFRYFMDKPLQVKPQELPKAEIERTVKGSIVHEILEKYHEPSGSFKIRKSLAPRESRAKTIEKVTDTVFAAWEEREVAGEPAIWAITKEQVKRVLSLYLQFEEKSFNDEPFTVVSTEQKFGVDGELVVSLNLPGGEAYFNGLIDRLDYLNSKNILRVVDYKYSSNTSKFSQFVKAEKYGDESFQVPIYLLAALYLNKTREDLSGAGKAVASYITLKKEPKESAVSIPASFSLDGTDEDGFSFDNVEFISRMDKIVSMMKSGEFSVTPKDCVFCRYRRACRYREVMSVELGE